MIGSVGLHNRRPDEKLERFKQREIGYIPEAVEGLLHIGFLKMDLDIIWCGHFKEN